MLETTILYQPPPTLLQWVLSNPTWAIGGAAAIVVAMTSLHQRNIRAYVRMKRVVNSLIVFASAVMLYFFFLQFMSVSWNLDGLSRAVTESGNEAARLYSDADPSNDAPAPISRPSLSEYSTAKLIVTSRKRIGHLSSCCSF